TMGHEPCADHKLHACRRNPSAAMRLHTVPGRSAPLTLAVLGAILTLPPLPGHAATFTPPQGCRLEVTVQNRGCTVSQIYRCESDPKGDQRSTIFNEDGPTHHS